jgi:hypothetical protein
VVTTNADIPTTSNGQQTDSTTTMLTTHEKTTDQITTLSDITTTDLRTTRIPKRYSSKRTDDPNAKKNKQ